MQVLIYFGYNVFISPQGDIINTIWRYPIQSNAHAYQGNPSVWLLNIWHIHPGEQQSCVTLL